MNAAVFFTFLILLLASVLGSPQCNLGLKLFSIESGRAVCAPIAPFQCVASCEWINGEGSGGCEQSSHFAAFRGRRTFLSGIVLSEQSILLQCCASLATSVQLGDEKETMCHWTEQIETVVGQPNVRFERVLGQTEYYRNLAAVRNGPSAVKLRAEVCRYSSERTFCERNKMSDDDFHKYSLLLMRLQRTKEFMRMKSDALEQKESKAKEENISQAPTSADGPKESESNRSELANRRREIGRAIFKNRTNPIGALLREAKTDRINKNDGPNLLNAEHTDDTSKGQKLGVKIIEGFGRRFWGEEEEKIADVSSSPIVSFSDNSSSFPIVAATTMPIHFDSNFGTTKVPLSFSKTTAPFFIDPPSKERIIFNDPRSQKKKPSTEKGKSEVETLAKEEKKEKGNDNGKENAKGKAKEDQTVQMRPPQNHEATMGPQHLAIRRIRYPQQMEQTLWRSSLASSMSRQRGAPKRRIWPNLATNATKVFFELIPVNTEQKWTNGKENWRGIHQIRSGNVGKNWQNLRRTNHSLLKTKQNWEQNQSPITIRALSPSSQSIAPANRHELRIKKLSRNSTPNSAALKQQIPIEESQEKQFPSSVGSASGAGGSFASAEPSEEIGQPFPTLSTVLPQALPQISTHPLEKAPQFKFLSLLERPTAESATASRQSQFGTEGVGTAGGTPSVGGRLMECCQRQGPGCRAICRRDVDKEQVKKVMVSGQCPPVAMTGVIQCFPRVFNISSVGKCCAQRTKFGESNANPMSQQAKAQQTLPLQCLSLCAPNFHLTFAHLACVDHIEHILDCYRQLLEDNGPLLQQRKMNTFPSASPFS